jgi:8-oxo-dGTP diphosphatase
MYVMLVKLWRLLAFLRGTQWYVLWLAHHKFIIGVSGVILDERGRILLQRHRFWKEGSWGLPSGYAERGESLEETLCREVREETGLAIEVTRLLRIVSSYRLRIEVNFVGRLKGGDLKLDPKEVIEAAWFAVDDLPAGLLPTHREIIALAFSGC